LEKLLLPIDTRIVQEVVTSSSQLLSGFSESSCSTLHKTDDAGNESEDSYASQGVVERTKDEIGEEVLTASCQLSSVFSESSSSILDKTDDDGNESGDLCASQGEVERSKEDDDLIDKDDDGDLEDYAGTQNFNDDRPEDHKGRWSKNEDKQKVYIYIYLIEIRILTNQIHFQVYNDPFSETLVMMKKKKVTEMLDTEKQRICLSLIDKMRDAYDMDEDLLKKEKPATYKLNFLPTLKKIIGVKSLQDCLLDNNILAVLNDWITPKSASSLTSLAVRREVYELVKSVLNPQIHHLKSSGIAKTLFALQNHKMEIHDNKVLLKEIIEKWCRLIIIGC
jgi:hypothetical protein